MTSQYTPIIGLEVHVELNTKSKMFCGCSADHFAKKPNSNTCPTCLGLPGAMPYPNIEAIKKTILFGMAYNCLNNKVTKFDRKHYFYPDLPKGYQISQYDKPFCFEGSWKSQAGKIFRLRRIHLEEDTGKLVHQIINGRKVSLIDFNRSCVPLMEIVTEPDFRTVDEVSEFLKNIQLVCRYLNVSNADMEKGSMRLEANISLLKVKEQESPSTSLRINSKADEINLPDYKVELKNINSFRFLGKAINSEIERQTGILMSGKKVFQETRGFDPKKNETFLQRSKEEAKDYRYFPEPDIPGITIDEKLISDIRKNLVELPWDIRDRFSKSYGLSESYSETVVSDPARVKYFDRLIELSHKHGIGTKTLADLVVNKNLDKKYPEPELLILEVLKMMKKSYSSSAETEAAVLRVLGQNKKALEDFKSGKGQAIGYLIGCVQKELSGTGEVEAIKSKILEYLEKEKT